MSKDFFPLLKKELFSLAIEPLWAIVGFIFAAASAFRYFFSSFFFVFGAGSSDVRLYFAFLPYILILIVPALTMSAWNHIEFDETLPVSEGLLVFSKWFSALASFCVFLIPCAAVPLAVSFFGDVDFFCVVISFAGIICFASASLALGVFVSFKCKNRILAFVLTALVIAASNSAHLVPLYLDPSILSAALKTISFAWHFDAASKGIIDSRDIVFFAALTWFFLMQTTLSFEKRRTGIGSVKKFFPARFLCALVTFLFIAVSARFPLNIDASGGKRFSVSTDSARLLDSLDSPVAITYYVSPDLKNLYPQTQNILDFLQTFAARGNKKVILRTVNPQKESPDFLLSLGLTGQEINLSRKNRLEYMTVYSGIVIEYLNTIEVIPYILSSDTLEYELDRRILNVLNGTKPLVYVVSGNEMPAETNFSYALSWLESAGFMPLVFTPESLLSARDDLLSLRGLSHPLVLFGTSMLTQEQSDFIEQFLLLGGKLFCAVSPNAVDVLSEWTAFPQTDDTFIPVLKKWGAEIGGELTLDISCFRLTLQEDAGESVRYEYKNYPHWITILPQFTPRHIVTKAANGINVFWASPLTLTSSVSHNGEQFFPVELLRSSPASWLMKSDNNIPFITNPFLTPASASSDDTKGSSTLGAVIEDSKSRGKIVIVSSQYFAADIMLEYTSNTQNLDFFVNSIIYLRGEENLLELKSRFTNTSLYKLDDAGLAQKQIPVLFVTGIIVPLAAPALAFTVFLRRKKSREKSSRQKG